VELTSPCEEVQEWHNKKLGKCLLTKIKEKGWQANLFAVEVGAKGYCSSSVVTCLKKLWILRNSSVWNGKTAKFSTSVTVRRPPFIQTSELKRPKIPIKSIVKERVGFVNKVNTCYANSLLQALPSIWSQAASENSLVCPLIDTLSPNLTLLTL